jgi:3'(2'), 5'-bisphosphate nucleotidase
VINRSRLKRNGAFVATESEIARLLDGLTLIASRAAAAILAVPQLDLNQRHKPDSSPVTAADDASETVILAGLAKLMPGVPVVSEETTGNRPVVELGRRFFVVDPLDGTREFLAGLDEFTVNIALIENETPVAGVLAAPARGLIWRGHVGHGAERFALSPGAAPDKARERVAIRTRARPASGARVLISRSHLDAATDTYIDRFTLPEKIACGSALKFGLLAEGSADLYPRLGPMSEWDIAAGHAVLIAAGGAMRKLDGSALRYGQGNFLVAGFIAAGDVTPIV